MMHSEAVLFELPQGQLSSVKPLFQDMEFHLATQAILAGVTHGRAWVDDLLDPQTAMLVHGFRYYLAGRADNDGFNHALQPSFFEHIQAGINPDLFIIYPGSPNWEGVLEEQFLGKKSLNLARQYYETQARPVDWESRLRPEFNLRTVDPALLADLDLHGLEALREEMCSERDSVDEFLEKSFGIVPVFGNQLAGWCLSEYNLGQRCEIGIASLPPFQRLGLATACTLAFIDLAYTRGIRRIGWHCYSSNRPSIATARKAGLTKEHEYNSIITWFHDTPNNA